MWCDELCWSADPWSNSMTDCLQVLNFGLIFCCSGIRTTWFSSGRPWYLADRKVPQWLVGWNNPVPRCVPSVHVRACYLTLSAFVRWVSVDRSSTWGYAPRAIGRESFEKHRDLFLLGISISIVKCFWQLLIFRGLLVDPAPARVLDMACLNDHSTKKLWLPRIFRRSIAELIVRVWYVKHAWSTCRLFL